LVHEAYSVKDVKATGLDDKIQSLMVKVLKKTFHLMVLKVMMNHLKVFRLRLGCNVGRAGPQRFALLRE
jgi:hypothetical protein